MSDTSIKCSVIVVAAGSGSRAGGDLPKQYQQISGMPLIQHTLNALQAIPAIQDIICVINPDDRHLFDTATAHLQQLRSVAGGRTRQESVLRGLQALERDAPDYVLVHDAARPFVSADIVESCLNTLTGGAMGVVPAVKVTDTLKSVDADIIGATVDREKLYAVQTPQGFPYQALLDAHKATPHMNHTDDAAVMESAGHRISISHGTPDNFKVTVASDFKKAEKQIMSTLTDIRTGIGYDVHRLVDGDHVWLCGVKIPHIQSLKGHSDADVAMHALTDALYMALSAGDIGTHFPPTDPQWKGAPSHVFLSHAMEMVTDRGGMVAHLGVTVICENPKVGPHKDAMRQKLAEITSVPLDRISVQATTTEKLGFTGRDEGIAAQAVATVRLP